VLTATKKAKLPLSVEPKYGTAGSDILMMHQLN